ncbi:GNAT family N-acetyltransferase [uncultured Jatrophihabitans sp.]|uniref:GNAT family N-acetyltransferase n=1 Tax=uncultured Jatrophihabitans sp. TaxID=1610747 RepID=UPI0035C9C0D7
MDVLVLPEQDVPAELQGQVRALHERAWPTPDGSTGDADLPLHDPALRPVSVLLVEQGAVVASLAILSTSIVHVDVSFRVSGLSTVVTDPDRRGRGHGDHLVRTARDVMAAGDADIGIFTCDRPLAPFYERAGWPVLPGAVLVGGTVDRPLSSDASAFDKVTLAEFFSAKSARYRADFEHARIALYPGEVDRLL